MLVKETMPLCVGVVSAVWPSDAMPPPPKPITAILSYSAPLCCKCSMSKKLSLTCVKSTIAFGRSDGPLRANIYEGGGAQKQGENKINVCIFVTF